MFDFAFTKSVVIRGKAKAGSSLRQRYGLSLHTPAPSSVGLCASTSQTQTEIPSLPPTRSYTVLMASCGPKYSDLKTDNRRCASEPQAQILTPLPERKSWGRPKQADAGDPNGRPKQADAGDPNGRRKFKFK